MTTEQRTDPRKNFTPRFLPWLSAVAAFVLYWFTLNHWVSSFNLGIVTMISGWSWQPDLVSPLFFLVTWPFRWLPTSQIPLALNAFSALCAALTLGLLARSVALLPHDRTDAQRKREHSDFSFLTIGSAWLPPLLAVMVCGLQMTFWEHATNCTGEMFDLLLFAFVIWSLLEYRLDEREGRLYLASVVYGAGMANNAAMVAFFPVFISAIVWIRGLHFFNLRFLQRMVLCGLLGLALIFLLPLLIVISGNMPITFWEALKLSLYSHYGVIRLMFACIFHPGQNLQPLSLLLAYLLPLLMLSIRWKSSFGDHSKMGMALTSFLFHMTFATFFFIGTWMAFDPPFSPRHLGFGTPSLTLYYLGTLSIGYFCGYFLLLFSKEPSGRSQPQRSSMAKSSNLLLGVGVWAFAVAAIAGIACRNTPQIRAVNDDTLRKYASFVVENLPPSGGILLSDDANRLFLVQAALAREGRTKDFLPLDTQSLNWPPYLRFLHAKYPQKWPQLVSPTDVNLVNPIGLLSALTMLAKTNDLYYLHPSFGYYFEQFYQDPHGLAYQLHPLPTDTLLPPLPDKNQTAANEAFWARVEAQAFPSIERAVTPPDPNAPQNFGQRLLNRFHVLREQNPNAIIAGIYYSRSLNYWGVQLQHASNFATAAACFARAKAVNPDNFVAQINLDFNENLRAGKTVPLDLSKTTTDQFGKFHSWQEVLNANGPFDEPSFCLVAGVNLATENGFFRQAVAAFARVRQLMPDNLAARLWLGQIYVKSSLPDPALEALRDPLEQPGKFSLTETNETELNMIAAAAYYQKKEFTRGTKLLETEIARHPADDDLIAGIVRIYLANALFTDALNVISRKLHQSPEDPSLLFSKGYVSIQIKDYDGAIDAFNRVLATQTNNSSVLFNRALAYLDSDRLDAARADYRTLQQTYTNSVQIAYGLGEIARRQHDTNEAIRNYEIYLANANTNTDEARVVAGRLRELKVHSP